MYDRTWASTCALSYDIITKERTHKCRSTGQLIILQSRCFFRPCIDTSLCTKQKCFVHAASYVATVGSLPWSGDIYRPRRAATPWLHVKTCRRKKQEPLNYHLIGVRDHPCLPCILPC